MFILIFNTKTLSNSQFFEKLMKLLLSKISSTETVHWHQNRPLFMIPPSLREKIININISIRTILLDNKIYHVQTSFANMGQIDNICAPLLELVGDHLVK